MTNSPCRWRRGADCTSPSIRSIPGTITDAVCAGCFLRDHEPAKPTVEQSGPCQHKGRKLRDVRCKACQGQVKATIYACAVHTECTERNGVRSRGMSGVPVHACRLCDEYEPLVLTPSPGLPRLENPLTWAVGVTTAPRSAHRTLPECVQSIQANGWQPTLYAEPGTDLSGVTAPVVQRPARLGLWHNWISMCRDLLDTGADVILTVQDDTVFHPQAKWWCETHLQPWPGGLVSLYTPYHYAVRSDVLDGEGKVVKSNLGHETAKRHLTKSRRKAGWTIRNRERPSGIHRVYTGSLWGACAWLWPRELLERVIGHPIARNWLGVPGRDTRRKAGLVQAWREKRRAETWRIQNSDTAVGKILNVLGESYYCVHPSLADHIADASSDTLIENSTNGQGHGGKGGRRSAGRMATRDLREEFA